MNIQDTIKAHLRSNPELANNLKAGSEAAIAEALAGKFRAQDGDLVFETTNLVWTVDKAIRTYARPFMKTLSDGAKYKPKYSDTRSEETRKAQAKELHGMLEERLKREGKHFIAEEPVRVWLDTVSQNFLWESTPDGNSFNLVALQNGHKVKTLTFDEAYSRLSPYEDKDKSGLAADRINAGIRKEALELAGMTQAEVNADAKKAEILKPFIDKLKAEKMAIPTRKRMPDVPLGEIMDDLKKYGAFERAMPLEKEAWTLQERTHLEAYAKNVIEKAEENAFAPFTKNIVRERSPEAYKKMGERFEGLQYEQQQG